MADEPTFDSQNSDATVRLALHGRWTIDKSRSLERGAEELVEAAGASRHVVFDLAGVAGLDTAGAWLLDRSRSALEQQGATTQFEQTRPEHAILLRESRFREFAEVVPRRQNWIIDILADVGAQVCLAGKDMLFGISFLGEVVASLFKVIVRPTHFRGTSVVYHVENYAFRALPIVALINFLVGCIVAQQSLFQLSRFGAATFSVELIGILVLRELAVLLTSIMIAGRSGSAITAELGAMKMREEIDALFVMGLDPIDVLVLPRLLALLLSLPLLTFIADMAALFGGLLVCWVYGGLTPEIFLSQLKDAIDTSTFLVGLIKAPFMALVIGTVAAIEGFEVEGSAESLGRHVTNSVVKAIFMVIVMDGFFAIFFAGIHY
ncbi:MAG TPA: MlaE family lipid ABC transporter permease subunit [Beijerinckiaceae bacterium]|jgi:phospholipid/cholesterol/gamma-HCH transport system permease protein|nr:MlaE family lipid ABC transporter permease subunit [Beijerinckiaceae bacterium]